MDPIYPLSEERISQFCGSPVLIVMKDGTRHIGQLTACRGGKVLLNGGAASEQAKPSGKKGRLSKKNGKSRKASSAAQAQAPVQPYSPYGYGGYPGYGPGLGPALTLSLAAIAFMFLLV